MPDVFHWIEVRAFCHPTEQEDRVRKAIETAAPGAPIRADPVESHFGPPLIVLTARIEDTEAKKAFGRSLKGVNGFERLIDTIRDRVDDDCVMHFRLDKQRAFSGELALVDHDDVLSVRAKVASFPAKRNEAAKRAKAFLAGM